MLHMEIIPVCAEKLCVGMNVEFWCASSPLCFLYNGKELSVEYTDSQTQLYYLYYCYNEGSNNVMFRPYMWAIFRL